MNLTAKAVAGLTLPDGKNDAIHFDDQLPGFGFRLRRHSATAPVRGTWIAQFRVSGVTRRVRLGDAKVLNAEAARAGAKKILAKAALGGDPQEERQQERRGKDRLTLHGAVAEYLAAKQPELRASTMTKVRGYLTGAYFRPLQGKPLDAISRGDIAGCLVIVARVRGPMAALRARDALHAAFVWMLAMGLVEVNPVIGVAAPKAHAGRERALPEHELAAVWRAAAGDDDYGRIVRLLILLGCRRQEVGGMRWSELDADAGVWTLPGERSKNHRPHTLALPPAAWEILDRVPRMAGRDQLFGVSAGRGFSAWAQGKAGLDRRLAGAVAEFQLRDVRRSVATGMAELGVQPHIIEAVLNHQSGHKRGVAGIYNRASYAREMRAALALWADHVRALVDGGERKILPLRA